MRVVVDTNVLVSALLVEASPPAQLLVRWRRGRFVLLTADPQLEEVRRVTRYQKLRDRLRPAVAGRLVNDLQDLAERVDRLPPVDVSPDPYDNYLLSIAAGGRADYLVTGDKTDLLALGRHGGTRIVTVRELMTLAQWTP